MAFGRRAGPGMLFLAAAVVLAALGALVHYRVIGVPALRRYDFELVLAGFAVLLAGALMRRL